MHLDRRLLGWCWYIVAAIVVPEAPLGVTGVATSEVPSATGPASVLPPRRGAGYSGVIFGLVLVIAGAWFLIERYVDNFDTELVHFGRPDRHRHGPRLRRPRALPRRRTPAEATSIRHAPGVEFGAPKDAAMEP